MCLAVPGEIIKIYPDGYQADVNIMGNVKRVSIFLTPEAKVGDRVMVHAGQAISVIEREEAEAIEKLWEELLRHGND
ncbi:MAG: hydrogenase expression/formation protein HypC [Eubacteriales bacterium]|nr:hydrogenase expression/formation protein HypC [Eubacteriales bacterium]MDN5364010.1 hydrogenase expression/formation protein HypC [Eubacteriales bacterium]